MKQYIILTLTVLVFAACQKTEEEELMSIIDTWKVVKYENNNGTTQAPNTYLVTFTEEGTLEGELDVNSCGGYYTISPDSIDLSFGCSEICCDNDFALQYATLMNEVVTYEFKRQKVFLYTTDNRVLVLKRN